jgi:hypothetical protein
MAASSGTEQLERAKQAELYRTGAGESSRAARREDVASWLHVFDSLSIFNRIMTRPKPRSAAIASPRCPRCGRAFDCGKWSQPFECWCAALLKLPPERLAADARCLCPECLADEIAKSSHASNG